MQHQAPRIAVLVDTSSGWGRRVISGIAKYALKHGPWQLSVEEHGLNEAIHIKHGWEGDGVIARVKDRPIFNELVKLEKPVVNVSSILLKGVDFPRVTVDHEELAKLALQHFTERGFQHLAYYNSKEHSYIKPYRDAFVNAAEAQKLECHVFHSKYQNRKQTTETARAELNQWLNDLPKPVAILTWGTSEGRRVLNVCNASGLAVPEQIAVLAGDDDELLCKVCSPPMSGIVTPAEQIGYNAAHILDTILQGGSAPDEPLLLKQTSVNTRQSTDTLAIEDPVLSKAIQYIRQHAHLQIQVQEVAEAVQISRRALERRFATTMGHTPAKEIQKFRLERAKQLLRETSMDVVDVAAASGYSSPEYMIGIFRKATGYTPLKYRNWIQAT